MDKRCYSIGEKMIDKEFTEDIYDIEQEPLDLNISTFGKYFPAKSLEKFLEILFMIIISVKIEYGKMKFYLII